MFAEDTEDTIVIIKDIDKKDLIIVLHQKGKVELLQAFYKNDKQH